MQFRLHLCHLANLLVFLFACDRWTEIAVPCTSFLPFEAKSKWRKWQEESKSCEDLGQGHILYPSKFARSRSWRKHQLSPREISCSVSQVWPTRKVAYYIWDDRWRSCDWNSLGFQGSNGRWPEFPISVLATNWWWITVTNGSLSECIIQVDPTTGITTCWAVRNSLCTGSIWTAPAAGWHWGNWNCNVVHYGYKWDNDQASMMFNHSVLLYRMNGRVRKSRQTLLHPTFTDHPCEGGISQWRTLTTCEFLTIPTFQSPSESYRYAFLCSF